MLVIFWKGWEGSTWRWLETPSTGTSGSYWFAFSSVRPLWATVKINGNVIVFQGMVECFQFCCINFHRLCHINFVIQHQHILAQYEFDFSLYVHSVACFTNILMECRRILGLHSQKKKKITAKCPASALTTPPNTKSNKPKTNKQTKKKRPTQHFKCKRTVVSLNSPTTIKSSPLSFGN